MLYKTIYAIQPYHVGQKGRTSTAMIIPSPIVKEFNINKNTILILRTYQNGKLMIETMRGREQLEKKDMLPVDKGFQASGQQV